MELLQDAEQIEDDQSRAHNAAGDADVMYNTQVTDFDLTSESAAVITVSAASTTLGVVTEVNGAAQRILGWSRRELVGKSLSSIIPEPIASAHDGYLGKFLLNGV